MMAGLASAFAIQTAIVYTDPTADGLPMLDELALRGRQIWLDYNCQACHQIHGPSGRLLR